MAKKQRSAKQKANDKRLGAMARKKRKVNKVKKTNSSMARRRKRSVRRRVSSGFSKARRSSRKLGGLKPIIDKTAKSIGTGVIFADAANKIGQPQLASIAELGGQFVGGGIKGTALAQLEGAFLGNRPSVLSNAIGGIGNIFQGQGQSSNSMGQVV